MSGTDADIIAQYRGHLCRVAELSMAMVEDLAAAETATDSAADKGRLTDAFCRVSRCLRMAIALDMRLVRGDRFAARDRVQADLDDEALDDSDDEDNDDDVSERDDFHEREDLYDRLPSGDPDTQIAAVARDLGKVARALSAAKPRPIVLNRDYEALCRNLIANDPTHDPPPAAPRGVEAIGARGPPR